MENNDISEDFLRDIIGDATQKADYLSGGLPTQERAKISKETIPELDKIWIRPEWRDYYTQTDSGFNLWAYFQQSTDFIPTISFDKNRYTVGLTSFLIKNALCISRKNFISKEGEILFNHAYFLYKENIVEIYYREDNSNYKVSFFHHPSINPPYDDFKSFVVKKSENHISVLLQNKYEGFYSEPCDMQVPKDMDLALNYGDSFVSKHHGIVGKFLTGGASFFLFSGPPGTGKCLGKNTPIMMYDGTIKKVQDISNGEMVMGPDSLPRLVSGVTRGREVLYKIIPNKGDPFVVNESHILSLKPAILSKPNDILNISVKDYLVLPSSRKHKYKLWRTGVEFKSNPVILDPYFLGVWLGDGHSAIPSITTADNEIVSYLKDFVKKVGHKLYIKKGPSAGKAHIWHIHGPRGRLPGGKYPHNHLKSILNTLGVLNNKHIPEHYKVNDRPTRLAILAGLIDTDGHCHRGGVDYISKIKRLADDVVYISRSLGLAAYIKKCRKCCPYKGEMKCGTYWRVFISGDTSEIPTRVRRKFLSKRNQKKRVTVTGFSVRRMGRGDYYGFQVDSDGLFLLGDFTATHNTTYIKYLSSLVKREFIFIPVSLVGSLASPEMLSFLISKKGAVLVLEDAEKVVRTREDNLDTDVVSTLLNMSDGILGNVLNISIIATYNAERETVDKAFLRKGRLKFEHEFKPLSVVETNRLLDHLKLPHSKTPLTLAEIYNLEDDTGHVEKVKPAMGFGATLKS